MVLILGEVWTTALANTVAASPALAEQALTLRLGERVSLFQRPISYAVSPQVCVGVDCRIPETSGALVRSIGTLSARACLTGGRLLQASVTARIEPAEQPRRMAWSHYLARLGVVETIGKADQTALGQAHLTAEPTRSTLGMGALCDRVLAMVQRSPLLDREAPFTAGRTVLRWAAQTDDDPGKRRVRFTLGRDLFRTVYLIWNMSQAGEAAEFCEDVARQDWLLSTVTAMVERVPADVAERGASNEAGRRARAAQELRRLWMPDARLSESVREAWQALERRPGFSRQWRAQCEA